MDDPCYAYRAYGRIYTLRLSQIREVWAIVSEEPGISLRRIAQRAGLSHGRTVAIFDFLVKGGTILVERPRKSGTARAPIPLLTKRAKA